ncbi:hypothetical protein F7725_015208 [Dissostichus mawsoni]|uniref:EGF-like domain-containing protein n=1 Tax=Dissostichus mawsoni TaxID=36200 RepID=A0A7J5YIA9_DISMA|nr:hypothetical protein F7725_015208 [Dissostichus mawsoni]
MLNRPMKEDILFFSERMRSPELLEFGLFFHLACDSVHWGPHCSNRCQCQNAALCNPITGACICLRGSEGGAARPRVRPAPTGTGANRNASARTEPPVTTSPGSASAHRDTPELCKSQESQCEERCPCQNGGVCHHVTGECSCPAGWMGTVCGQPCPEGRFGQNCSQECQCHNNGFLSLMDTLCQEECPVGTYGAGCAKTCQCQNNGKCSHTDGMCVCEPGYTGDTCDVRLCPEGHYGLRCDSKCPCYAHTHAGTSHTVHPATHAGTSHTVHPQHTQVHHTLSHPQHTQVHHTLFIHNTPGTSHTVTSTTHTGTSHTVHPQHTQVHHTLFIHNTCRYITHCPSTTHTGTSHTVHPQHTGTSHTVHPQHTQATIDFQQQTWCVFLSSQLPPDVRRVHVSARLVRTLLQRDVYSRVLWRVVPAGVPLPERSRLPRCERRLFLCSGIHGKHTSGRQSGSFIRHTGHVWDSVCGLITSRLIRVFLCSGLHGKHTSGRSHLLAALPNRKSRSRLFLLLQLQEQSAVLTCGRILLLHPRLARGGLLHQLSQWALGLGCNRSCLCVNGASCSALEGRCSCAAGWRGERCQLQCQDGTYGLDCTERCDCSHADGCHHSTGIHCDSVCAEGRWGPNCSLSCNCRNGASCSPDEGTCECAPGYRDTTCQRICSPGYFGHRCSQTCPQCVHSVGPCHHVSGHQWGPNCIHTCNCHNGAYCSAYDGECKCTLGSASAGTERTVITSLDSAPVAPDSWDATVNRCPAGSYGYGCRQVCDCLNNSTCDHMTGTCYCSPGWKGPRCDQAGVVVGSLNSLTSAAMQVDTYQIGAIAGIIVLVLLVLFLLLLFIIYRKKQKVKEPTMSAVTYTPALRVTSDYTDAHPPPCEGHPSSYFSNPSYHTLSQCIGPQHLNNI